MAALGIHRLAEHLPWAAWPSELSLPHPASLLGAKQQPSLADPPSYPKNELCRFKLLLGREKQPRHLKVKVSSEREPEVTLVGDSNETRAHPLPFSKLCLFLPAGIRAAPSLSLLSSASFHVQGQCLGAHPADSLPHFCAGSSAHLTPKSVLAWGSGRDAVLLLSACLPPLFCFRGSSPEELCLVSGWIHFSKPSERMRGKFSLQLLTHRRSLVNMSRSW